MDPVTATNLDQPDSIRIDHEVAESHYLMRTRRTILHLEAFHGYDPALGFALAQLMRVLNRKSDYACHTASSWHTGYEKDSQRAFAHAFRFCLCWFRVAFGT